MFNSCIRFLAGEVIEAHASHLEQTLLRTVGVLAPGMVFPVWVGDGRPIRMEVGADDENADPV